MDSTAAMSGVEKAAIGEKMRDLIQKVPLGAYEAITNPGKSYKKQAAKEYGYYEEDDVIIPQEEDGQFAEVLDILHGMQQKEEEETEVEETDHDNNMKALLIEYRKQLIETSDLIKAKNEEVPHQLRDAIRHISNQIGHWAGQP